MEQEEINELVLLMYTIMSPEQKAIIANKLHLKEERVNALLQKYASDRILLEQDFRFDLKVMTMKTRSYPWDRPSGTPKMGVRLRNCLCASDTDYFWQIFATPNFIEGFRNFRQAGEKTTNELIACVASLGLPEIGSITFTEKELALLDLLTLSKDK